MQLRLSAIVLTKNEASNIIRCLKSLEWCDEIIVLDDYSTDKTIDLIKNLKNSKISIVPHSLDNDFSESRNYGLARAIGEWVLFVDADERVSEALAFEISNSLSSWSNRIENEYSGFYIRRFDHIWGKELRYGESGIKLIRLAQKNVGGWVGKVHEKWQIKGKVGILKNPLIHYPHQTVAEFLQEINFYTSVRAEELYTKNTKAYWWSIICYPLSKFIVNYFFKRGFLDGIHGLVFAIIMSFHSFLVRGKLWLL